MSNKSIEVQGSVTNSIFVQGDVENSVLQINPKVNYERIGDVVPVKDENDLKNYYGVKFHNAISIHDVELNQLRAWIENWKSIDSLKKPILLITGKAGAGKSWLSFRLIHELLTAKRHKVFKVIGKDIHKFVDDDKKPDESYPIFILDDQWVSVLGEVKTFLTSDSIYELIKSFMPTGAEQKLPGPLILTMREENWNNIISGSNNPLGESELKQIVETYTLPQLSTEETEKLIKSFYSEIDGNSPKYTNFKVETKAIEKIIVASQRNPMVIRLFFDTTYSEVGTKNFLIREEHTRNIVGDSVAYIMKLLFYYYFSNMENEDEIMKNISFLLLVANRGFVSVGHLRVLRQSSNILSETLSKYIYLLLSQQRALPLFLIDSFGIVMPYNNIVTETIGKLRTLDSSEITNDNDLSQRYQTIRDLIDDFADYQYSDRYDESLARSLDYFYSKVPTNSLGSTTRLYEFLSLIIEFLKPGEEYLEQMKNPFGMSSDYDNVLQENLAIDKRIPGKSVIALRDFLTRFISAFQSSAVHINKLDIRADNQLYWIFDKLNWFEYPIRGFEKYYLKLLSSDDYTLRTYIWFSMVRSSSLFIQPDQIKQLKHFFLELLKTKDKDSENNWLTVNNLISIGVITIQDKEFFLRLLSDPDQLIRARAWYNSGFGLLKSGIISMLDMRELKEFFLEVLSSPEEETRIIGWDTLSRLLPRTARLIPRGFVNFNDLKSVKKYLLELLKSQDNKTKRWAWHWTIIDVVRIPIDDIYIITEEDDPRNHLLRAGDIKQVKKYFLELLSSSDEQVRSGAWDDAQDLLSSRLFSVNDLQETKKYFLELLGSSDEQLRKLSWEAVCTKSVRDSEYKGMQKFVKTMQLGPHAQLNSHELGKDAPIDLLKRLVTLEDLTNRKKYFLELLKSADNQIRDDMWNLVIELLLDNVLTVEDLIAKKQYYFEILHDTENSLYLEQAWRRTVNFMRFGIIGPEDKAFFLDSLNSKEWQITQNARKLLDKLVTHDIVTREEIKPIIIEIIERPDEENRRIDKHLVPNEDWNMFSLLKKGIVTREEIKSIIIELLGSLNEAWEKVYALVKRGIVPREEIKPIIIELLGSLNEETRYLAWDEERLIRFLNIRLLEVDDLKKLKQHYLELLKSPNERLREWVWYDMHKLLLARVIEIDDLKKLKQHYLELLKSPTDEVMKMGWEGLRIADLRKFGLCTQEDFVQIKNDFIRLLKSEDMSLRMWAWEIIVREDRREQNTWSHDILKSNLITFSDLKKINQYFLQILRSDEVNAIYSWYEVPKLVSLGVITSAEMNPLKAKFFEFLESEEEEGRLEMWRLSLQMLYSGIVTANDLKIRIELFLQLLRSSNQRVRNSAQDMSQDFYANEIIESDAILVQRTQNPMKMNNLNWPEPFIMKDNIDSLFYAANERYINDKQVESISYYEKILEADPNNEFALVNLGVLLDEQKRFAESLPCYDRALGKDPNNAYALFNKGMTLSNEEMHEPALEYYSRVTELEPTLVDAWFKKAELLNTLERYEDSTVCYNKLLELEATNFVVWYNYGTVASIIQRYDLALSCFEEATKIKPEDATTFFKKSYMLYQTDQSSKAVEEVNRAIELEPLNEVFLEFKAFLLHSLNKFQSSLKFYTDLLILNPLSASGWYAKGELLYEMEDYFGCMRCMDKAIELNVEDDYLNAWIKRGDACMNVGKYTQALVCFNKVIEQDEKNPDALKGKEKVLKLLSLRH